MRTYINKLPRVGDRIMRPMAHNQIWKDDGIEPCIVTYVNKDKNWYQVTFVNSGIKECYKVPSFDHYFLKGKPVGRVPIICLETGNIYGSITECAGEMKLNKNEIWRQIDGRRAYCSGYHFITDL